jgi:hypothetical protein
LLVIFEQKKQNVMYELLFWKYLEGVYLNHHEVYEAIEDQAVIDGLEELPVQVILNRIASVFSKWEKVDDNSWKNNSGVGAFQVKTTPQSIQIDWYGTDGKTMDSLVNIMEEFKCPLYDPQVPERYDEMNE